MKAAIDLDLSNGVLQILRTHSLLTMGTTKVQLLQEKAETHAATHNRLLIISNINAFRSRQNMQSISASTTRSNPFTFQGRVQPSFTPRQPSSGGSRVYPLTEEMVRIAATPSAENQPTNCCVIA